MVMAKSENKSASEMIQNIPMVDEYVDVFLDEVLGSRH